MQSNVTYLVIFAALLCFWGVEAAVKRKFFKFGNFCDLGNEFCDQARHLRCDREVEKCVCEEDLIWDPKASIKVSPNFPNVLKSRPAAENEAKGSCVAKAGDQCGEGPDHVLVTCQGGLSCVSGKNCRHGMSSQPVQSLIPNISADILSCNYFRYMPSWWSTGLISSQKTSHVWRLTSQ